MNLLIFLAYLLACALVGFLGRKRFLGFWGFTVVSFFFTPLPVLIIVILTAPKRPADPLSTLDTPAAH